MNRSNISLVSNTTTGQNVGGCVGIYKGKVGTNNLQFRSLSGGSGIVMTCSSDGNTINLFSVSGGSTIILNEGITGATSLGSSGATGIYTSVSDCNLKFKSLSGGSGISISSDANMINICSISLGSITGGTNGLSTSGKNVILVGTLTGNTSILNSGSFGLGLDQYVNSLGDYCGSQNTYISVVSGSSIQLLSYGTGARIGICAMSPLSQICIGGTNIGIFSATQQFIMECIDASNGLTTFIDSSVVPSGITYAADYSATYTPHTLVDKAWVLSQIGGGSTITGGTNGLSTSGANIVLGGALTGDTNIDLATHLLNFNNGRVI